MKCTPQNTMYFPSVCAACWESFSESPRKIRKLHNLIPLVVVPQNHHVPPELGFCRGYPLVKVVSGTSRYESKSQPTPFSISGALTVLGWSVPASEFFDMVTTLPMGFLCFF